MPNEFGNINEANIHVTEFMGYGEGCAESVVLDDGTRIGDVAHGAQFGQAKGVAFEHLRIPANVFSANWNFVDYVPSKPSKKKEEKIYLVSRRAVSWWEALASLGSLKLRCHLQKLRNISDADLPGRLSSISWDSLLLAESSLADVSTNSWSLSSNMRTTAICTRLPKLTSL